MTDRERDLKRYEETWERFTQVRNEYIGLMARLENLERVLYWDVREIKRKTLKK